MTKNQIIFTQNALTDPQFNTKKSVKVNQIHSLLCIPLAISHAVIGALYLDSRIASGIFAAKDKDFLVSVSKILASVIEKSQTFQHITDENILFRSRTIKEIGAGLVIGSSAAMRKVYELAEKVSKTDTPVLLRGETGTGKGMLARYIHVKSKRKNGKFLAINCGAIPETLLESELFGHKKGAFTGAVADKEGLLEAATGGTVFLDEIANTSLEVQAKLLQAIEEKHIRRLGETKARKIDVRFLFATNNHMEEDIKNGKFRKDLYYRINVISIRVPTLRQCKKDIPVLARFFLKRYNIELNKNLKGITSGAMKKLRDYNWPGNVRELQNVIERAVVLALGTHITSLEISLEPQTAKEIIPLQELEKRAIGEALEMNNWNISRTAKQLGIGRVTLWRHIKEYNIQK
jgi:transcriptional regulator with PAS, ATPase and Fis domain